MIELSLLKQMETDGFGTLDTDLFLEEAPLDSEGNAKDGLWLVPRGTPVTRLNTRIQAFDIYTRYKNKLTGSTQLNNVLGYLQQSYSDVCDLPEVPPYTTQAYKNVRITPTSSVESLGSDENGKVVRVISGEIYFELA